jgi:Peptidase family S41
MLAGLPSIADTRAYRARPVASSRASSSTLRNNPGGLLDQAVSVTDAFLRSCRRASAPPRKPNDSMRAGDLIKNRPVIVLINGGSASASEIVAGAPPIAVGADVNSSGPAVRSRGGTPFCHWASKRSVHLRDCAARHGRRRQCSTKRSSLGRQRECGG